MRIPLKSKRRPSAAAEGEGHGHRLTQIGTDKAVTIRGPATTSSPSPGGEGRGASGEAVQASPIVLTEGGPYTHPHLNPLPQGEEARKRRFIAVDFAPQVLTCFQPTIETLPPITPGRAEWKRNFRLRRAVTNEAGRAVTKEGSRAATGFPSSPHPVNPVKRRSCRAFTMIEIAIAVGVIGFALVAIIGILPRGMNVQKDNREETIISQDAPYFLNAIRNGEMRTNNNVLTSFVESITVTNISGGATTIYTYDNPFLGGISNTVLTNDMAIIGYLTTPEMDSIRPSIANETNEVSAIVRAMTGSAVQQNGANSATAFRYQLTVEIVPWNFVPPGYSPTYTAYNPFASAPPPQPAINQLNYMSENLHEVRLRFAWPVLPNGAVGPNRQTYRSYVSGQLTNLVNTPYYFFQPQNYSINNP